MSHFCILVENITLYSEWMQHHLHKQHKQNPIANDLLINSRKKVMEKCLLWQTPIKF